MDGLDGQGRERSKGSSSIYRVRFPSYTTVDWKNLGYKNRKENQNQWGQGLLYKWEGCKVIHRVFSLFAFSLQSSSLRGSEITLLAWWG